MNGVKVVAVCVGSVIALCLLAFGLNYAGLLGDRFFQPREEQLRHQTFECSDAHVDGLVRDLRSIRDQYNRADDAGKAALSDTFRHEANGFTCGDLPYDLQSFSSSLK
jgi:hypothetical protein